MSMYVFSSVLAITERSEMGLYDVPMFMSLFGFGIRTIFASFNILSNINNKFENV